MPDPADQNARAHVEEAGQQLPRRRRDLRRADGELTDTRTGTVSAATPSPASTPNAGELTTRRASWAEAAADATKRATRIPAPTRAPDFAPVREQLEEQSASTSAPQRT